MHECPECSQACNCNGDIDDLMLNEESATINCKHYLEPDCDGFIDDDNDEDIERQFEIEEY